MTSKLNLGLFCALIAFGKFQNQLALWQLFYEHLFTDYQ